MYLKSNVEAASSGRIHNAHGFFIQTGDGSCSKGVRVGQDDCNSTFVCVLLKYYMAETVMIERKHFTQNCKSNKKGDLLHRT